MIFMFPAIVFQPDWINRQRRELGNCDPAILEKCVHALTLLGYLAESGLQFIFKGGTSLLLHLPEVRRLSRDIDIVCGRSPAEINGSSQKIGYEGSWKVRNRVVSVALNNLRKLFTP